jgi:heme/copper-type cytochrome/quinol oxidase subunit 3
MVLFLFTETMFFAGLISAFIVLRGQAPIWPPPGQPRLPVAVTGASTVVLLASGFMTVGALRAVRRGAARVPLWIACTVGLGFLFLAVQGVEWARLLGFGLTTRSGVYGATFYAIIGIHAAHVVAALAFLFVVWRRTGRVLATVERDGGVRLAAMFWLFVVAVWPLLYALLYEPWRR